MQVRNSNHVNQLDTCISTMYHHLAYFEDNSHHVQGKYTVLLIVISFASMHITDADVSVMTNLGQYNQEIFITARKHVVLNKRLCLLKHC